MSGDRSLAARAMPNGPGAAAVLAAGIGCFALAVLACLADKVTPLKQAMNLYRPTGPLSGVTTGAISIWLLSWGVLGIAWRNREVAIGPVCAIACVLLLLGMLLTFPPIADLL